MTRARVAPTIRRNCMAQASAIHFRVPQPGLVFALVFGWKLALLLVAALPVPANDAFFYDGAVVNWLLHGRYVNPSLAQVLPIAGTEVFSAYPPLYQAVLLPWMAVFGTSALSAMWLHLALFGGYLAVLLAIFRRLGVPNGCACLAGLFLLGLTFHDRPDSLAQLFGMLAVYAWIRSRPVSAPGAAARGSNRWAWAMAGFAVLGLATSLQIGATYIALLWLGAGTATFTAKEQLPIGPLLAMVLVPVALALCVVFCFPLLWAGFQEHARHTPSFTGLRVPRLADLLKVGRTVPAALAGVVLLPGLLARRTEETPLRQFGVLALAATLTALAVVLACLTLLTPNVVGIAGYLQPLIVGCVLAWSTRGTLRPGWARRQGGLFLLLALLCSVRAIGLTTWGVACAADVSYSKAIASVRQELSNARPGEAILCSSAYLYEAARHPDLKCVHSDWPGPADPADPNPDLPALLRLKPTKLLLTQFDYFRRYEPLVAVLKSRREVAAVVIRQTARLPTPDSVRSVQRIVQHISWAPVIVDVQWKP